MKKIFAIVTILLMMTTSVSACPLWECQYDVSDYSCGCSGSYNCSGSSYNYCDTSYNYDGGSCSYSYNYNEYSGDRQPIYCQYCGNEMWDCTCGTYQESNYNCNYNYQESYTCSGNQMDHWANIRDCYGNIIGQVDAGSSIEVCGVDSSSPDRVLIYDYATGTYGSVLSECVYGGYQWDGTGDNGYYNQYQGGECGYEDYGNYSDCTGSSGYDCGYYETGCGYSTDYADSGYCYDGGGCDNGSVGCGGYNAYSQAYYVTYCESVVQRCVPYGFGGGFGCGLRGMC